MRGAAIKFREMNGSGKLTRMQGGACRKAEGLYLEMAGSVSIAGPLMTRAEVLIPWSEVEQVRRRRKVMKPWKVHLCFIARTLDAFREFPDAVGFEFEVRAMSSSREVQEFLSEVNLAIAEEETVKHRQRIESSLLDSQE